MVTPDLADVLAITQQHYAEALVENLNAGRALFERWMTPELRAEMLERSVAVWASDAGSI